MKVGNLLFALTVALPLIVACNADREKNRQLEEREETARTTEKEAVSGRFQRRIGLEHGFEIKAGGYEQLGPLETYTLLVVTRHGKEVFKDSSLTEYTFGNTHYPEVRRIGQEAFELLLQVNDRPNRDYLRWVKVLRNQLVKSDSLPL
ncbi:MAG: hypothetical protein ICV83_16875, partial [Cytophagales bacterium]|nr:hypothetical protein [Cytophagales bacterium]